MGYIAIGACWRCKAPQDLHRFVTSLSHLSPWLIQRFLHALRIELEKVDPRANPNLLLEETSQEFWDNMSRKPYAKAILKSERHWSKRRALDQGWNR